MLLARQSSLVTSRWRVDLILDDGGRESFVASDDSSTEFVLIDVVRGRHPGPPTRGVFACWRLADPGHGEAFEASRRALFGLRQQFLDSFVCDLLLRPTATSGEYVVVGLYADEQGLALARNHPAIVEWAREHPATALGAEDTTGMRVGTVAAYEQP